MPSSTTVQNISFDFAGYLRRSYGWRLQVHRSFGVQDEVEQAAVAVVALKLNFKRGGKVQGLRRSGEPRLDVVGLLGHAQPPIEVFILIMNLLLVVGDQGLLRHIRLIIQVPWRDAVVLESAHFGMLEVDVAVVGLDVVRGRICGRAVG